MLDRNGNFTEHLGNVARKSEEIVVALGRLMPNLRGNGRRCTIKEESVTGYLEKD